MSTVRLNSGFFADFSDYISAGSNSTEERVLRELASHHNPRVRMRVAENVRTPIDVLTQLARDESADVRVSVGTNPVVPLDIVQMLSLDNDVTVRLGLAQEPSLPDSCLSLLSNDENPYVAAEADRTLALRDGMSKFNDGTLMNMVRSISGKRRRRIRKEEGQPMRFSLNVS